MCFEFERKDYEPHLHYFGYLKKKKEKSAAFASFVHTQTLFLVGKLRLKKHSTVEFLLM